MELVDRRLKLGILRNILLEYRLLMCSHGYREVTRLGIPVSLAGRRNEELYELPDRVLSRRIFVVQRLKGTSADRHAALVLVAHLREISGAHFKFAVYVI